MITICSTPNCGSRYNGPAAEASIKGGWRIQPVCPTCVAGIKSLTPGVSASAGGTTFIIDDLPTREQLALRVAELERQLAARDKIQCAVAGALSCEKQWQSDIQKQSLERSGLADEFPYGCDAIDYVAEALVNARGQIADLKRRLAESEADNDPPVCRLQFPDGTVPCNAREAADGWKREYDDLCRRLAKSEAITAALKSENRAVKLLAHESQQEAIMCLDVCDRMSAVARKCHAAIMSLSEDLRADQEFAEALAAIEPFLGASGEKLETVIRLEDV